MNHEYFRDRISAYHDGDLPPQELELMRRHLEECPGCRSLLVEFEKFDRLVERQGDLGGEEYWELLAGKIESRLVGQEEAPVVDVRRFSWKGLTWKLAAVAASFAAIGFVALHQSDIIREVQEEKVLQSAGQPSRRADTSAVQAEKQKGAAQRFPRIQKPPVPSEGEVALDSGQATGASDLAGPAAGTPPIPGAEKAASTVEEKVDRKPVVRTPVSIAHKKQADLERKVEVIPQREDVSLSDTRPVAETAGVEHFSVQMAPSPGTDSTRLSSPQRTLADWRHIRDSAQAVYDSLFPGMVERSEAPATVAPKKSSLAKAAVATPTDTTGIEKTLVEACCGVGRLTDDKGELEQSIRLIQRCVQRSAAGYSAEARDCLEGLRMRLQAF